MILNWCNPDAAYTDTERIVGTIYDAGVIRRSNLIFLLGWSRSKTDHHLLQLRKRDMVVTARDHDQNTVYMLNDAGVRFAHQLMHVEAKIITFESQITHQLGVNDILLWYIRTYGRDGVRWYSTREAADELWDLRRLKKQTELEIRRTYIRPDALLRAGQRLYWIEYDNATESSRQIRKKYTLYGKNLHALSESLRTVVWVAPNEERARWLEAKWNQDADPVITMKFYKAGDEDSFGSAETVDRQPV